MYGSDASDEHNDWTVGQREGESDVDFDARFRTQRRQILELELLTLASQERWVNESVIDATRFTEFLTQAGQGGSCKLHPDVSPCPWTGVAGQNIGTGVFDYGKANEKEATMHEVATALKDNRLDVVHTSERIYALRVAIRGDLYDRRPRVGEGWSACADRRNGERPAMLAAMKEELAECERNVSRLVQEASLLPGFEEAPGRVTSCDAHAQVGSWPWKEERGLDMGTALFDATTATGDVASMHSISMELKSNRERVMALGVDIPVLERDMGAPDWNDGGVVRHSNPSAPGNARDGTLAAGLQAVRAAGHGHQVAGVRPSGPDSEQHPVLQVTGRIIIKKGGAEPPVQGAASCGDDPDGQAYNDGIRKRFHHGS